jgi:hypothetical protein
MPTPEADNARNVGRKIADKHMTKGNPVDQTAQTKPNRPLFALTISCPDCKTKAFHAERDTPGFISTPQFNACPDCGSTGLFVQATFFPFTK